MSKNKLSNSVEIKISTVVAVSVILHTSDMNAISDALGKIAGGAPDYFENEFAVIDVAPIQSEAGAIKWATLADLLKKHRLNAVAVRNAPAAAEGAIVRAGLSLDVVKNQKEAVEEVAAPAAPVEVLPEPVAAAPAGRAVRIIDKPVRTGVREYAEGDMIVTAIVNSGAELVAGGNIHVYAPLRGRALAGAHGDVEARIFALSMEAELVSIGGIYTTSLPGNAEKKAAQVRLSGDRIDVLPI